MTKEEQDEAFERLVGRGGAEPEPRGRETGDVVGDEPELGNAPSHRLFSPVQLARSLKGLNEESKEVLRSLQLSGAIRKLTLVPDHFRELCGELAQEFPNFEG